MDIGHGCRPDVLAKSNEAKRLAPCIDESLRAISNSASRLRNWMYRGCYIDDDCAQCRPASPLCGQKIGTLALRSGGDRVPRSRGSTRRRLSILPHGKWKRSRDSQCILWDADCASRPRLRSLRVKIVSATMPTSRLLLQHAPERQSAGRRLFVKASATSAFSWSSLKTSDHFQIAQRRRRMIRNSS
jgi:hypothetical protein